LKRRASLKVMPNSQVLRPNEARLLDNGLGIRRMSVEEGSAGVVDDPR
jgi:hypothetical protein